MVVALSGKQELLEYFHFSGKERINLTYSLFRGRVGYMCAKVRGPVFKG